MMAHYLVDPVSKLIVNTIVVDQATIDSQWSAAGGLLVIEYSGPCGIGWLWDGQKAVNPASPSVPAATTAAVGTARVLT